MAEEIQTQEKEDQSKDNSLENSELKDYEFNYKWGEMLKMVRVRFPGNSKSFPFLLREFPFTYGQSVMALSDRGIQVGYINSFPYEVPYTEKLQPLKTILKKATEADIQEQLSLFKKEKETEEVSKSLINKLKLDMTITHVEMMQSGKKAVIYFNAPSRIDFRDLVKDLVKELKLRIELRQISLRERTAAIGGVGVCGLQTCCSSFLTSFGHVGIKHAKNQNLSISPNRINGICGQIKCCLKYEDEVYTQKKKILPKEGKAIKLTNGDIGKVLKVHVIKEQFDVLTDQGIIKRFGAKLYNKEDGLPPKGHQLPKEYGLITNETDKPILEYIEDLISEPAQAKASPVTTESQKVNTASINLESNTKQKETDEKRPNNSKNRQNHRQRNKK
jgi:cell fate regulator YaaT (PSP1 superfamily)